MKRRSPWPITDFALCPFAATAIPICEQNEKALRRFPGHRARFPYDDLVKLFSSWDVQHLAPFETRDLKANWAIDFRYSGVC